MRQEIIKELIELRKEYGFDESYVAEFLGISKDEYVNFEACKCSPEDDYFIISGLARLYSTTLESIFDTVKGNKLLTDILGEYTDFTENMKAEFSKVISNAKSIGIKEFSDLKKQKKCFKFSYITKNGKAESAVLTDYDKTPGHYFVISDSGVHIAEFKISGGETYFEINGRIYPEKLGQIKAFAKIYARLMV